MKSAQADWNAISRPLADFGYQPELQFKATLQPPCPIYLGQLHNRRDLAIVETSIAGTSHENSARIVILNEVKNLSATR